MKLFRNKKKSAKSRKVLREKELKYELWLKENPLPHPTEEQARWLEAEIGMFCHFGINTFNNKEWSDGTIDAKTFNPTNLDCNQWVQVAKDLGANYMIVTAKHHDGFCLWQTKTTDYSVASSPWKDGKGDIVREFVDACRTNNMKFGFYLSPWDRHEERYGCYKNEKAYDEFYNKQLTELLTEYAEPNEVFEIWFDGAGSAGHTYNWSMIMGVCEKYHPNAMIFNMGKPTIRWVGNESGLAKESNWNVIQKEDELKMEEVDSKERNLGLVIKEVDGLGNIWMPAECDTPIRDFHWFHHTKDKPPKSLRRMIKIYEHSVGRGSNLLLNLAPNRKGLIDDSDAKRARELSTEMKRRYNEPIAVTQGSGKIIELELNKPTKIDTVISQEDIRKGQKIREYAIEYEKEGNWIEIYRGTSIGHKKIDHFKPIIAEKIRLKILYSFGTPEIKNFSVFRIK